MCTVFQTHAKEAAARETENTNLGCGACFAHLGLGADVEGGAEGSLGLGAGLQQGGLPNEGALGDGGLSDSSHCCNELREGDRERMGGMVAGNGR